MEATIVKKGRGTNLLYRDYAHKKDRKYGMKQHWRCVHPGCPGRIHTINDSVENGTAQVVHLIYQINCDDCQEFYIGMTNRRLETRIREHKTNENSALFKHSFLTDHNIIFSNPKILTKDNNTFRLQIKETLKIKA